MSVMRAAGNAVPVIGNVMAMRCARRPAMRLASPGTLVCSWITRGTPAARAASATGSATKPPVANTRSGSSRRSSPNDCSAPDGARQARSGTFCQSQ